MINPKLAVAAALFLAALAIVAGFLLLPSPQPATPPRTSGPTATPGDNLTVGSEVSGGTATFLQPSQPAPAGQTGAAVSEDEWVERLDNLLDADEDNSATARKLIAALPALPPEAQEEYVAHAVNLCGDEDFGLLANVYLASETPPIVAEIIFDDALNRPDDLKLPMLAKTLQNPTHPLAGESREILEMYLDLEPAALPASGWEAAVQQYLREEAAAQ